MITFLIIVGTIIHLCLGLMFLGAVTKMYPTTLIRDDDAPVFFIVFCWPLLILVAFVFALAIKLMSFGEKAAEKIEKLLL